VIVDLVLKLARGPSLRTEKVIHQLDDPQLDVLSKPRPKLDELFDPHIIECACFCAASIINLRILRRIV